MSRDTGYLPKIVLASGAWEFMSLNVPTVAAVDWTEKGSGACGVPVAVCLVFDVFNHEFPSEVLCPSPQAMSNRQLVDFKISRGHVHLSTPPVPQISPTNERG